MTFLLTSKFLALPGDNQTMAQSMLEMAKDLNASPQKAPDR
jgi:hypothetical protein